MFLTIFNNGGQQFYAILNGIKQNSQPQTNVYIAGIKNGGYSLKIIFSDGKTADVDKNLMIDAPMDITTRIIFKKGKGKLQLMGQEPTHGVIQEAVVFRPSDAAVYSDAVVVNTSPVQNTTTIQTTGTSNTTGINMNVNIQETPNTTTQTLNTNTTTTTTTTTGTIPDENVNLNMNLSVGGVNVNLNANASATGLGTGATITETTSSSSTTTTQINNQENAQHQQVIAQVQQAQLSNRVNCTKTMNRLEAFKAELQDQSFEEDRLEALQLAMKSTCLTAAQAEQLIDLFNFDENRLEVAKYLSDRLTDRDNAGALAQKLKECREPVLKADHALEMDALPLLRDAIAYCETVRDYVSRDLFAYILKNEEEHVDFLETQFEMIERMGLHNYCQLQSAPAGDS